MLQEAQTNGLFNRGSIAVSKNRHKAFCEFYTVCHEVIDVQKEVPPGRVASRWAIWGKSAAHRAAFS